MFNTQTQMSSVYGTKSGLVPIHSMGGWGGVAVPSSENSTQALR